MTKEHPIIFSAPMVRAILDGRKTQTRRMLKPQPKPFRLGEKGDGPECEVHIMTLVGERPRLALGRVLTGQEIRWAVGERLWVREAFSGEYRNKISPIREWEPGSGVWYWADGQPEDGDWTKPRSPIYMPRWASRITLLVTDVRVQRVQDITEADAEAEAAPQLVMDDEGKFYEDDRGTRRAGFAGVWASLHGSDGWDNNPWVAAITFERVS